ncbi:MAG: N,N-dimethylformamidase beta subunit family domain-containing protein, partial [Terriglobales bacterium]
VRDDARVSDYLFQTRVTTYQAYDNWGGKSLYAFNSPDGPARKVSFNRPYEQSYSANPDGAGHFLGGWEYNMVRFLEREGYDLTYVTDLDVHENGDLLLSHKAFLVVGHDEYWSWEMRSNVVAARDANVSLGFFASDTCYWQVRLEPSVITGAPNRTIVAYKDFAYTEDPYYLDKKASNNHLVTVRWRKSPVNMPEDAFIGVMYESDPVNGDIVVADASNWAFAATGLQDGDHLPGLLGYEVDRKFDNTPPGTVVLAHSPYPFSGTTRYSDMTAYPAATSATVFATGSMQWSWGLDDYNAPALHPSRVNPAAQQITRNVLARLISDQPPLADPGGPYSGTATQSIQFDGNGSSDPDGVVLAYEWNFGDGATGTGNLTTHAYSVAGTYSVTLIVTDDKGSRNSATTTATITAPWAAVSLSSQHLGRRLEGLRRLLGVAGHDLQPLP